MLPSPSKVNSTIPSRQREWQKYAYPAVPGTVEFIAVDHDDSDAPCDIVQKLSEGWAAYSDDIEIGFFATLEAAQSALDRSFAARRRITHAYLVGIRQVANRAVRP